MIENKYTGENAREFFRIVYPINEQPKIRVGEDEFPVIDLSEKGVKFSLVGYGPGAGGGFKKDATLRATIMLHDGDPVDVEGKVVRATDEEVVLNLRKGLRFSRIIREQWYLIGKYKHLIS